MGRHDVQTGNAPALRKFTRQLLRDVQAMEYMLDKGMFETGVRRIGAEQELFLVDRRWQPAPVSEEVLSRSTDDRLVNELTRFNLECNLTPYDFEGDCLSQLEKQLTEVVEYTRGLATECDAEVVLTGILPTIHLSDLGLENMAPKERYFALNDALNRLRGGPAQFQIRGVDELFFRHDTILVEGCNTSFQTHFQVAPDEFARFYNIAQAVAGPALAAAVNSPVLFGKRLWRETRIALFQQAVDTRGQNLYLREMSPRVHFGSGWIKESVLEVYREDIARFRVLLAADEEDAFEKLRQGEIPKLSALQLHNGTVYRWNRACYGITGGKPHLRIENRILPAGPSIPDEVANAALWFGMVSGIADRYDDITDRMDFDDTKNNFIAASRLGLGAQLTWLDDERMPADDLILERLLPIARDGLLSAGIDEGDTDRYLGIIERRVESGRTGAQWIVESLARMRRDHPEGSRADRLNAVVAAMASRQKKGLPGHEWTLARIDEATATRHMQGTRVEHFMTTDLFTVNEEELVELVACLMDWRHIRHVLVEDTEGRLVGLVTHRSLLRHLSDQAANALHPNADMEEDGAVAVKEIMVRNPITVTSDTSTVQALQIMRDRKIGALPVLQDGQLVGIITDRDFYSIAGELLDDSMIQR